MERKHPARAGRSRAPGVLIAGTTSDAGKSFVATALCRLLARRGWDVRPFKGANMSLNSTVADDGGELASAQWVQCVAARTSGLTASNPVLYKSEGPGKVEVLVRGRVRWRISSWAEEMPRLVPVLKKEIRKALEEVRRSSGFVVAEGAGSPAEVNLRRTDLSNFLVARWMGAPVVLVADLERGGTIAQVVGTLRLLSASDRARVKGILLNRMRGDERLLRPAVRFLERETHVPVLGVLPYLDPRVTSLPPEDSLSLSTQGDRGAGQFRRSGAEPVDAPAIGILKLPHASNFSEFTPLTSSGQVRVAWVQEPAQVDELDAIILPGSRRTRDDLVWMRTTGWEEAILRRRGEGLRVAGICGGYQMLGDRLVDPQGFEGPPGITEGLGLLPITTRFGDPKIVRRVVVKSLPPNPWYVNPWYVEEMPLEGFEIRRGRTTHLAGAKPIHRVRGRARPAPADGTDGAVSSDKQVWGSGVHGLLESSAAIASLAAWVSGSGKKQTLTGGPVPPAAARLDATCEALADLLEAHVDLRRLGAVLGVSLES